MVSQAEDKKLAGEIYVAATGVGRSTTIGGTDANGFDAIADAIKDVQINAQVDPDAICAVAGTTVTFTLPAAPT